MPDSISIVPRAATGEPAGALSVPGRTPEPQDNTDRYLGRVADHLATLAPAARLDFLIQERAKWLARYDRFCARVETGEKPHWGETATDYVLTIAALGARIARERREQP